MGPGASSRDRPLQDKRVAVTRAEDGAGGLADQLRAHGAVVIAAPLLRLAPPADPQPLHAAAARMADYDWVVFTSANAVRALRDVLRAITPAAEHTPLVAAVGPATARAVENELGWRVQVIPEVFAGEALVRAMQRIDSLRDRRVLWPRAAAARETVRADLEAAGARLDAPEAYCTVDDPAAAVRLADAVAAGELDVLTFTSPSAVHGYARSGGTAQGVVLAVIGATTAAAARDAGFTIDVQPTDHTFSALVDALAQHLLTEP